MTHSSDKTNAADIIAQQIGGGSDRGDYMIASNIIDALHAAGYVIVPRKPTKAMLSGFGADLNGPDDAEAIWTDLVEIALGENS